MIKLKKCPHCGGEVVLCALNGITTLAYGFSIICTGCGLETRMVANPNANCCLDMGKAVNEIVEKRNRREAQP